MKQEDRDRMIRMEEHIIHLRKAVEGNGKKGLIDRVAALENWRYYIMGGLVLAVFILTFIK